MFVMYVRHVLDMFDMLKVHFDAQTRYLSIKTLPKHFKIFFLKKIGRKIEKMTSENSRFWHPEPRFV